jgi:hypothetical protein
VGSGSASFAPEPAQKDLARLRNEIADGAEKTTIYYQDRPPAVTVTFKPEAGAVRYRVAIFRVGDLGTPAVERTASESTVPLEAGALSEGSYLWSVTPLDARGQPLRGGRMNKLEMVYDNSVPSLMIKDLAKPRSPGAPAHTAGVAPVGCRMTINGRSAELDDKNRFDMDVRPDDGLIVYRLMRPGQPDAWYVRQTGRRGR